MSAPLIPEEQDGLFKAMTNAGIDFEETNTLVEIERELALKIWLAARAHYTAEMDNANAEASRFEDDRAEAREERDALAAETERLREALDWLMRATEPLEPLGKITDGEMLDLLDARAKGAAALAALAPDHSTEGSNDD